jgi:hypothetical protein
LIFARRHELKSTVMTSNRQLEDWHDAKRSPIALTEFEHRFSTLGQDRRKLALEAMLDLTFKINVQAYDERGNRVTSDPNPSSS